MSLKCDGGEIISAQIGIDGNYVISGGEDCKVRIWKISSGKCIRALEGHTAAVNSTAFCPQGRYGISASADKTIRIWELASGKCIKILNKHKASVTSIACDAVGEVFATGGYDKLVRLWRSGKWRQSAKLKGHGGPVLSLAANADGGFLISGSADRTAAIWDINKRKALRALKGHLSSVDAVALSFDAGLAATGSADWTLRIWDARKGKRRFAIETEETSITALAFDPESPRLAAADSSGLIRLYDARSGELMRTLGGKEGSVAFMCPFCRQMAHVPQALIGQTGLCPACGKSFTAAVWAPEDSRKAYDRALRVIREGNLEQALRCLEEAITHQHDNYEAHIKAVACRYRMAEGFAEASRYLEAVEMLQAALEMFNRARPWPGDFIREASKLAYDTAFLAGKICRFSLSDAARAREFCRIAQTFFDTPEVEDLLAHMGNGANGEEGAL
jgi:tetratricopeptide (TPR) repeat protein